ncbi:hypothetical protein HBA55_23795 [Pseudomaricurvus alkylphenolicus]|uniref:hypothetical protein n=1 Tax=Pseudomaricurvus alkylphenolicus TaxID=1306991 RepID=UPI001421C3AB|nr:hypothetical protein [Pseudomaricurvus alkylphenolicus]NIB42651.1 hypothetical protein [Pseudomaricurvus alkylphenolicus]
MYHTGYFSLIFEDGMRIYYKTTFSAERWSARSVLRRKAFTFMHDLNAVGLSVESLMDCLLCAETLTPNAGLNDVDVYQGDIEPIRSVQDLDVFT